jgi:hypothetical protein
VKTLNRFLSFARQAIQATRLLPLLIGCVAAPAHADCPSPSRFALNGAEATDVRENLVWRRCSVGLDWREPDGCVGQIRALSLEGARRAAKSAGEEWRLPSADELLTLVDRACGTPAIDARVFPDVPIDPGGENSLYWTSTAAGMLGMNVTVDFREGFYDAHSPGLYYFVRLVKAAKPK